MQGYIKLHRQIIEWEWYKNTSVKVLFLHCLLRANHADKKWQGVLIKKGSFITSLDNLSFETGLSKMQIRTALEKLKLTHEITYKPTRQYSMITINNWDKFQLDNTPINTQITYEQHTFNTPITLNNNEKNDKNEKNEEEIHTQEVAENEKYYGTYLNVLLSAGNYNKLLGICSSKELLETVINELSEAIEIGRYEKYKSEFPNAHYVLLQKFIKNKRNKPSIVPFKQKERIY